MGGEMKNPLKKKYCICVLLGVSVFSLALPAADAQADGKAGAEALPIVRELPFGRLYGPFEARDGEKIGLIRPDGSALTAANAYCFLTMIC